MKFDVPDAGELYQDMCYKFVEICGSWPGSAFRQTFKLLAESIVDMYEDLSEYEEIQEKGMERMKKNYKPTIAKGTCADCWWKVVTAGSMYCAEGTPAQVVYQHSVIDGPCSKAINAVEGGGTCDDFRPRHR